MKPFMWVLVLLVSITSLISCKDGSEPAKQNQPNAPGVTDSNGSDQNHSLMTETPAISSADVFEITGTVVYRDLEGGFYAIDTENGSKYDPMNLPDSFKKDGLKVKVKARLRTDVMGSHMYGSIIEIKDIVAR